MIFYRFIGYTFTSFLVLVGRIDWMNEDGLWLVYLDGTRRDFSR
jgi:hypothetical protein